MSDLFEEPERTTVISDEEQKKPHLFQKGQSGNPNGRPKGTYSLKTLIERKLRENPDVEAKLIADLLEKEQGLLYQMIDGKPKQAVEMSGELNINDPERRAQVEKALDEILPD